MTLIKYLRVFFLSLYWNLPHSTHRTFSETHVLIEREVERKKEKKKLRRKLPQRRPPVERRPPVKRNYSSSKPRDVRFSNQQKLRRMYWNG